jgi:prepilin-type N-terminal cleavage/methylation domain-containing protein
VSGFNKEFGEAVLGEPKQLESCTEATDDAWMSVSAVRPGGRAGFTVLELMIVVMIIGALAAVGIPLFLRYQLKTRSAEGKTNLGAIRVLEQAHFSEFEAYLPALPEPPAIPGGAPAPFDAVTSDFADLGFAPEGRVYFSYGVAVTADLVGYTADAAADIDSDGIVQFWGYAKPDGAGVLVGGQVGCNVAGLSPLQLGPCDPTAGTSVF